MQVFHMLYENITVMKLIRHASYSRDPTISLRRKYSKKTNHSTRWHGLSQKGQIGTNLERLQEENPVLWNTKDQDFILNPCLLSIYKELSCEDTSFSCGNELIFNQELE